MSDALSFEFLRTLAIFVPCFALFSVPGIALYRSVDRDADWITCTARGIPIGIGTSATVFAVCLYLFPPSFVSIGLALVAQSALVVGLSSRRFSRSPDFKSRPLGSTLVPLLGIMVLCEGAVMGLHSGFGLDVGAGHFFRGLYATDLLHHMSVPPYITKGLPTVNPYFGAASWHYYWFAHTLPAFVYLASGRSTRMPDVMLATSLIYAATFVGAFVSYVRATFIQSRIVIWLVILAVFCYGFNDVFVLMQAVASRLPQNLASWVPPELMQVNGDSITGFSHGWLRSFVFEPHTTLALSVFLVGMSAVSQGGPVRTLGSGVFAGLCGGLCFAFDSFVGLCFVSWVGVVCLTALLKERRVSAVVRFGIGFSIPIAFVVGLMTLVGILGAGGPTPEIRINLRMLMMAPAYFVLEFGPTVLLAVGAMGWAKPREVRVDWVLLVGVCLFLAFFVNLSDVGSTQMFRKAGLVLRIPLLLMAAPALLALYQARRTKLLVLTALSCCVALPTPFVDMWRLRTPDNSGRVVSNADLEACRWIRENVPTHAVMQDYPSEITKAFAFGERRVAVGDWEHAKSGGIAVGELAPRTAEIRRLFATEDVEEKRKIIGRMSIDYLYVSNREREAFPSGVAVLFSAPRYFQIVYDMAGVSILKVVK